MSGPGPKEAALTAQRAVEAQLATLKQRRPVTLIAPAKQETTTMPTKSTEKAKDKPKAPRAAKVAPAKKTAPTAQPAKMEGIRPGTKLGIIIGLLTRKEGCTTAVVLNATGWPAVSMPQQARAAKLKLRKEKQDKVTRYWAAA